MHFFQCSSGVYLRICILHIRYVHQKFFGLNYCTLLEILLIFDTGEKGADKMFQARLKTIMVGVTRCFVKDFLRHLFATVHGNLSCYRFLLSAPRTGSWTQLNSTQLIAQCKYHRRKSRSLSASLPSPPFQEPSPPPPSIT